MKETISVNLASQAFTFDKDAYRRLKEYLDAIRRRLPAGDPEILNDVEARLAEIFRSRISSPMMVVTLQMVQGAMAQMGDPSEFGELPTGERFAYFRYADRTRLLKYEIRNSMYKQR